MPFTRPSLTTIIDRIEGDFKAGLGLTTVLRRSFIGVLSKALGGAAHTLHGFMDFMATQLFPDTAEQEFLERWASIWSITRLQATFAKLTIDVTSTTGGTVTAGTIYQRSDGAQYTVDAEVTFGASETKSVTITASDAGDDGNLDTGSTVSLTSPIAGIETDATVTATVTEGEDAETDDDLRVRLLERIRQPPSGGKATDYIAFAKIAGVTRVWVSPGIYGEGSVGVSFVEDNESPIIPDAAKVTEVQDAIEPLKPITADVTVFAPIAFPINPVIAIKENTLAVQAAVEAELEDLILREAQVAGSIDPEGVGTSTVFSGKLPISKIREAISLAAGEEDHVLSSPSADVIPPNGNLITLGTITFSTLP